MKFLSLNIRGFGSGKLDKRGRVRKMFASLNPCFVAIQETKLGTVNLNWIQNIWGHGNCNFIQKEKVGKSGGQLLIWDTNYFDASNIIVFDCVIGVRGKWIASGEEINILNVYGPHEDNNKIRLWNSLVNSIGNNDEAWIVCGDFNEVRDRAKRLNCEYIEYRARRFNDFINKCKLVEIPLGGRRFTRISDDGVKFSKLDRFLVSDKLSQHWSNLMVVALEREKSEHCPIVLKDEEKTSVQNRLRRDCNFKNKLKSTKCALKSWSYQHFGLLDQEIDTLKKLATELEIKAEAPSFSDHERHAWLNTRRQWLEKEKIKTNMLKQKAKVRWNLEGDENTSFFHSMIRFRNNKCNIRGIFDDGVWNEDPRVIKTAAFNHFKKQFEDPNTDWPCLEDLSYPSISRNEATDLELPFTETEIFEAINDCGSNKAPGPDGFNLRFYKKFWDVIKFDLIAAVSWFWEYVSGNVIHYHHSYLLAAEGLNILSKAAVEKGLFKGVEVGNDKVLISHLQYADDTIFFGEWNSLNAHNLSMLLKCFERASDLKVNFHKSCLYGVGASLEEVNTMAGRLGCQSGKLPFIYLGLPIGAKMCKIDTWNPVIDKLKSKLSEWRMRTMSFGGRLVLIKSVLTSLPLYYFSLFRAPPCVIKILESVRRSFLWGVRTQWWWRFYSETNTLWARVIRSIYGPDGGLCLGPGAANVSIAGAWRNIINAGAKIEALGFPFTTSFAKKIGDGSSTLFWEDHWIGSDKLCKLFPRLYKLESNRSTAVNERIQMVESAMQLTWNWSRVPTGRTRDGLSLLTDILLQVPLVSNRPDSWRWLLSPDGSFAVKKLTKLINDKIFDRRSGVQQTIRNHLLPKKIEIFIWRMLLKKVHVSVELDKKGIDLHSVHCPVCDDDVETVEHSIIFCKFAFEVWTRVLKWWNLGNFSTPSLKEILRDNKVQNGSEFGI
ncbi:uncharacterized protein [Rutidosis leptorrhynchoides]|uniref:uncharacterized protein n=1 Tax=Rutidosis leptorrhynchoides TaxID=125765 RepID=UPI003A9A5F2A